MLTRTIGVNVLSTAMISSAQNSVASREALLRREKHSTTRSTVSSLRNASVSTLAGHWVPQQCLRTS